jgi:hypothetical protein
MGSTLRGKIQYALMLYRALLPANLPLFTAALFLRLRCRLYNNFRYCTTLLYLGDRVLYAHTGAASAVKAQLPRRSIPSDWV